MYSKIAIPNMSDFIVTCHEEAYSLVKLKAVDKAVTYPDIFWEYHFYQVFGGQEPKRT